MTKAAGRVVLILSILFLGAFGPTWAEEPGSVPLALRDAVKTALERNLEIAVSRIDPSLASESVTIQESSFDPEVSGTYSREKTEEEPSSTFARLGSEVDNLDLGYRDPTQLGGSIDGSISYRDAANEYSADALDEFRFIPVSQTATMTVSYTQSLLRNFGLEINRTGIEQAKNSLQISEAGFRATVMDIVERTVQAYWNMVGAEQSLEVARQSLSLAEDFLKQTRIKVEVGTLPPIEVTTAEAEVASREEGVIVAESNLERSRDILRQLMRVPDESPEWMMPIAPLDQPGFTPRPITLEEAITTAFQKRPDIEQATLEVRNAELGERFQKNQQRPDLKVTGSYSATGNSFDYEPQTTTQSFYDPGPDFIPGTADDVGIVTFDNVEFQPIDQGKSEAFSEIPDLDNTFWTVRLDFTYPLMNRQRRAEFARSKLQHEQAKLRYERVALGARVEVRDAVRSLDTNARRVASARANLVLQRKKLEAEQKRYENGLSTAFQVLQFQKDLREAEQREISAIIEYNNAEVTYVRAIGTLLDYVGVQLDQAR